MVILGYIIMCMVFGTTFLAIKVGIDAGLPPFFSAGIRFLTAGAILLTWMVWNRRATFALLLRKEMLFTGIGLTFGTFSTLYWAEQHIPSGIAAVLSATGPIMILLLQTFILRQKASPLSLVGCLIGFAGVVLLLLPSLTVRVSLYFILGCLVILLGEIFYSSGALYSKHVIPQFPATSPIALNAAQMMHGGTLLIVLSLFTEQVHLESFANHQAVTSLLYLTMVGSMVGHSLFYWLVSQTNPVFPSTWLYISPFIALCLGVFWYNEVLSLFSLMGGMTIVAGVVLVNVDGLKLIIRKKEKTLEIPKCG